MSAVNPGSAMDEILSPASAFWLDSLDQFVATHGHASVPQAHILNGARLGAWVKGVRRDRKELPAALVRELEARPGWLWRASRRNRVIEANGTIAETQTDLRSERLRALLRFTAEHGHSNVPSTATAPGDDGFGKWVRSQRSLYAEGGLSRISVNELEGVAHWNWSGYAFASAWDATFRELEFFIDAFGHSRVPRGYLTESGKRLDRWVVAQRFLARRGDLLPQRRDRLDALPEWIWEMPKVDVFQSRIAELREASKRFDELTTLEPSLDRWLRRREAEYAHGLLPQDRLEALEKERWWIWRHRPAPKG